MSERNLTGRTLAITGVDGFVGRHLAEAAVRAGATVVGIGRTEQLAPAVADLLTDYIATDLRETWPMTQAVDAIVHLAGLSAVGPSFADPQRYIDANSAMVTVMCETLLERGESPRIVGVSTGSVYAPPRGDEALDENSPVSPTSPYAVSKLLVEQQLAYYGNRGLDTVVARPFNHIGAGQGEGFLVPDLATRLVNLAPGDTLAVGNLANSRDYSHVADVADAYLALAFAPTLSHFIYNVASGTAVPGNDVLALICETLGREVPPLEVDERFIRPTDPAKIVGSAERLRDDTGWAPQRDAAQAISEFVAELQPER